MAADLSEAKKASAPGTKRRGGQYSRPAFSLSWLMPLRPGSELVPEKRMMILTADQLEMATHGSDVLMILVCRRLAFFPSWRCQSACYPMKRAGLRRC